VYPLPQPASGRRLSGGFKDENFSARAILGSYRSNSPPKKICVEKKLRLKSSAQPGFRPPSG